MGARHARRPWIALAACAFAHLARGQLIAGNDQATPTLWLLDISGGAPRMLVSGPMASCTAAAADEVNRILYWSDGVWLYRAPYAPSGPLTPQAVARLSGVVTITGLAFDTADQILYARASGGIYRLDTQTAVASLVFAATAQDFGGFDYDPATNAFYVANDSTSTALVPGRGLYRIDKPLSNPTFTRLSPYPAGETDIDGLAAGGGILYLLKDSWPRQIDRYDLATGAFLPPLPCPYTPGSVPAGVSAGAAWAPGLVGAPPSADLSLTLDDAPDPVIPPGSLLTYTLRVRNDGPDSAANVTLSQTLPAGVTLVSATPPLTSTADGVSGALGNLPPDGSIHTYTVVVRTSAPATLATSAAVSSPTPDPAPSSNTASASTLVRDAQADLAVTLEGPGECTLQPGDAFWATARLRNLGPEPAQGVTLRLALPPNAGFLGSQPGLTPADNTLTLAVGALGVNAERTLAVQLQAPPSGVIALSAEGDGLLADPAPNNDEASWTTRVGGSVVTAARARGILSTVAGSGSSLVPGLPGVRLTALAPPFRSESGAAWIMRAQAEGPPATGTVVILKDAAGIRTVARAGSFPALPTLPAGGYVPAIIDPVLSINDAGAWAMSGDDTRANTAVNGFIVRWNGSALELVAQEGSPVPTVGAGVTFGSTRGGVRLDSFSQASFLTSLAGSGVSPADNQALLGINASWMPARTGLTAPFAQRDGNAFPYAALDPGASPDLANACDYGGWRYLLSGRIADQPAFDRVLVVDASVVAQEGVPLPGFSSPVAPGEPFAWARMEFSGSWFAAGRNADGQDWLIRDGWPIAASGDETTPGSGERWVHAPADAPTFIAATLNQLGETIIAGNTDAPDPLAAQVVVRNGWEVVLRANDPVDLNADGLFDEDIYVRSIEPRGVFLTDDGILLALVHLRGGAAARCAGQDTDLGMALVRVGGDPPPPPCDGDVNCDGNLDAFDIQVMEEAVGGDWANFCQPDPDFNHDGSLDAFDVSSVEAVVGGSPCP